MFAKIDYVYTLYEEKSFTKAAEKLFISQPSLSAAIKGVEELVGAPLFERHGKEVSLTEIGEEYIKTAKKILSERADFEKRIADIHGLKIGKIRVGGTNYLSSYVLPKIILEYSSLYPGIQVELVEAKSQTLHDMIREDQIDIIIDSFEFLTDEYEGYPLIDEKILLCVPEEYEINKSLKKYAFTPDALYEERISTEEIPEISIKHFKKEEFILLKFGNDMYNRATEIFKKGGISPKVSFSVDQMNISYALSASGMGLCFATDTLFRFGKLKDNVLLYNITEAGSGRGLYIARKRSKYCTAAMAKFIETARRTTAKRIIAKHN